MYVIVCPKCGVRNSITGATDSKKRYLCGKCGTMLPAATKTTNGEAAVGAITRPLDRERQEDAKVSKSATSYSLPTRVLSWFKIRENQAVLSLVLLALLLHLVVLSSAQGLVFDERYYVPEARSIIDQRAVLFPEHPSLGKLFIVSGMLALGDNPWGWRIAPVIFGVSLLVIYYLICRRLTKKRAALLACFLLVSESLTYAISGVAMLDVFYLTFMLLAFLLYLKDRYVLSGLSLALSALCKLTGVLGIFVILIHWLIWKRKQPLRNIALFALVALAAFLVLLPVSDFLASGHWMSPIDRLSQMSELSRAMTIEKAKIQTPEFISYPWTWILSPRGYGEEDFLGYRQIINPALWVVIIPTMGYMLYDFIRRRSNVSLFVLLWFAACYLVWIPIVLLTQRATFIYYFYPSVGAVCLGAGFAISRMWDLASTARSVLHRQLIKVAVVGYLALNVIMFLLFSPVLALLSSDFWASNTLR